LHFHEEISLRNTGTQERRLGTDLKLARFPTRSPLPITALPSMSLIPLAPFR
jgi:hypothetical protein